jgi:acetyltransferase-like isoleucine patch superfamily enzyme
LKEKGCLFTSIVHPEATLSKNVVIGNGSHIGWGTFVSCDVTIGQFVSLNCNLTIGHDAIIDDYVEVGPGTSISGFCHIEEGVHIAPNCTIIPGVRVGAWSKVSANTAVMRDVPPYSFVVGVPGTIHKNFFQHPDKQ